MKKLLLLIPILFLLAGCGMTETDKLIKKTSTENLLVVFRETSLITDINDQAYDELERRGYWKQKKEEKEKEAILDCWLDSL